MRVAPYIDVGAAGAPGTIAAAVAGARHAIGAAFRDTLLDWALRATAYRGPSAGTLELNSWRARKHRASGRPDVVGKNTLFSQAFRVLHPLAIKTMRVRDQL